MSKSIILRCDYFKGSGIGHLKRTSILASSLKNRGFNPILVIDEIPKKDIIFINVEVKKVSINFFNEIEDADLMVKYASIYNSNIVIGDSYRISNRWVDRIKKNGVNVVLVEDSKMNKGADLSINYTPINKLEDFSHDINQLRGPQFFLTDSKVFRKKDFIPKKIIAHAGGNGDYSKAKLIYSTLASISDDKGIEVDWICPNKFSLNSLKSIIKLNKNDRILEWDNDSTSLWSKYQIVVGPASTSLYEAILQGSLPVSFSISKTQLTKLEDWLTIGHCLHISNEEKENVKYINLIFQLTINHYKEFLSKLENSSELLDGKGVERVTYELESFINQKNYSYSKSKKIFNIRGIQECSIKESLDFLHARNSEEVRQMSTNPSHIITWPEHLKWWLNGDVDKFVFRGSLDNPEVYFWIKKWNINGRKYLTAGWFPVNKTTPFTSILKTLDWQIKHYSERFKGYTWVATVRNDNKAAISINRRVGFTDASKKIYNDLPKLFPGTNEEFKVFELKIKK